MNGLYVTFIFVQPARLMLQPIATGNGGVEPSSTPYKKLGALDSHTQPPNTRQ